MRSPSIAFTSVSVALYGLVVLLALFLGTQARVLFGGAAYLEATAGLTVAEYARAGFFQLVVAGGETSGACVQALGITQLRIGAQIDPGVPWCHAHTPYRSQGLHLALKSGNFGGTDFFHRAFDVS